ncbi:hypothetical protein FQ775_17605 [Nitratireductor mangrovi]|uniref:Lipoprotein n=1 Tax=Nitratireductor mangrovi TaxID=2599600 RepID=A0A5B8L6P2_9HYPH|nr:hypothetical protein FQ775_17605 [Nitratireductor mangrovi]
MCCLLAVAALAGCSSTDALDPNAVRAGRSGVPVNALAPQEGNGNLPTPPQTANLAQADTRLAFAPVVGPTVAAATPLANRLSVRAAQRGLAITGGGDTPATHLLKGYFSAISEDKETIVIFVWDVVGPDGNRLHRIQGQERVASTAPDAWAAVPTATMETIADRTIDEFSTWLGAGRG